MGSVILRALFCLLAFFQVHAEVAQPTSCVVGEFSSSGDAYYRAITLKLTNNCTSVVDLQDASVTFQSKTNLNTTFWGDFSPLDYPDGEMKITSQASGSGFLSSFRLHFPNYSATSSKLPPGQSILIKYGAPSDQFVQGSVNVYLGGTAEAASITFTNTTAKPANVTVNSVLVHVMLNGSKVTDVELPWQGSATFAGLTPATYSLSVDNVSDASGAVYQGAVAPQTIALTAGQEGIVSVSYAKSQATASLGIKLPALPSGLAGYTGKPVVVVTEKGTSSSTSVELAWNKTTTVKQLKSNAAYTFSTPVINYNGFQWTPTFNPVSVFAKATSLPLTTLTYQGVKAPENNVTVNVAGAPASLTSLNVTLKPASGASINVPVALSNGSGSKSVTLPDGVVYTVSADAVSGYSLNFSPQPLTSKTNAVETVTLNAVQSGTPVAINGQLKVIGTQLCNEQGQPIQLKGMSSHGLQWYKGCINTASMNAVANDFKADIFRLSLYVQEGGYETNPAGFTQTMNDLIKLVSDHGMYVIVDWHILTPGDPNYNFDRAKKFFTDVATANKGRNNLIYEICNEPNGVNWSDIKSYADRLIPIIRAIDPTTVIMVGTPGWSSLGMSEGNGPQEIINNPVNFSNVMYAFHFYAASHRDAYLNALDIATNSIPVFVSEFGMQTYDGDGANDFAMTDRYMELMAAKKISWTNWNFSDDFRSGPIWKVGTCPNGPWTDANLKQSGVYIKQKIQE